MLRYCLTFTLGVYSLYLFRELPQREFLVLAAVTAVFLQFARPGWMPIAFCCGLMLAHSEAGRALDQRFAQNSSGSAVVLEGKVVDFPVYLEKAIRFDFKPADPILPPRIRLNWYEPSVVPYPGMRLTLTVRLREPRGFANPASFDYEGWLLRNDIGAVGYVLSGTSGGRQEVTLTDWLPAMRARLGENLSSVLPADNARAVIFALALGTRHEMDDLLWEKFARTGTSHLVAISGLHIGLVAAGMYLLLRWLCLPLRNRLCLRKAALSMAFAVACAYALISGFGVPSRRAVIMLGLVCAWQLLDRELFATHWLSMALVLTIVLDPLSIFSSGFVLSFAAVITLILAADPVATAGSVNGFSVTARIRELARVQLVLCLVLLPMTALLFGRGSLLASSVNLLLLPAFALLIVPVTLLGTLLAEVATLPGDILLLCAHRLCSLALLLIDFAANLPFAGFYPATPPLTGILINLLTIGWVVLPKGFPGRGLAILAFLHVCLFRPERPADGCLAVDVLDVGQGQAVVLQTRSKNLVYDTGPRFRSGKDTGQLVVLPYLQSLGVAHLDRLIVSHGDLDHAGGVASILAAMSVGRLQAGEPERIVGGRAAGCRAGESWHWDGVAFEVLAPLENSSHVGNNASCVLLVTAGDARLLLTGDIERPIEEQLLQHARLSSVSVVTIPHHGSRTSSSAALVARLNAHLALASAGHENRWGFPKPDIVRRWRFAGTRVLDTAKSGAISFRLCGEAAPQRVIQWREQRRRFWNTP